VTRIATQAGAKRFLVGRTITAVDLNPFPDGRGGNAFDPVFTLDDGSKVSFETTETESQTYGIRIERRPGGSKSKGAT
jgi:hypothetical protein